MITPLSRPSTVLLTGATSGIGLCLKQRLIDMGHHVIAVSRTASTLPPTPMLEPIECDLADPTAVLELAGALVHRDVKIDLLLNNAALQYPVPLTDASFRPQALVAEASINLVAPALLAHALIPLLGKSAVGGTIVNISSGLAFHPKRATALYCATKAGLRSFTRSLRYQLADSNIHVVEAILPLVATPMTEGRGSGKMSADDAAKAILAGIASGRAEIFIGKAKLLKILDRVAPTVAASILKGA